jgi:GNAT superfamily N-acetyltransferase
VRADGHLRNPAQDRAELVRAGVRAELADQLVAAGLTARVRDQLLIITEHLDPIAGESRALVPLGAEIVIDDPDALAELVALARQRIPAASRLILVLGRPATLPVGTPYLRYVRAGSGSPVAPPADWQVRPTGPEDQAEVVPLLREALAAGYTEAGSCADPDALDRVAAEVFGQCLTDGWGFVARQDGRFTGHLTVVPDEDELTGAARWDLFDMFVLPPYRGGPSARLLTSAAAARAGDRPLRGHVAGSDANSDAVLERLVGFGWQPDDTYWSVPLS